jgi:hypothetical protein
MRDDVMNVEERLKGQQFVMVAETAAARQRSWRKPVTASVGKAYGAAAACGNSSCSRYKGSHTEGAVWS